MTSCAVTGTPISLSHGLLYRHVPRMNSRRCLMAKVALIGRRVMPVRAFSPNCPIGTSGDRHCPPCREDRRIVRGGAETRRCQRSPGIGALLEGHDAVISAVPFTASDVRTLVGAVRDAGVARYLVVGGAGSSRWRPARSSSTSRISPSLQGRSPCRWRVSGLSA